MDAFVRSLIDQPQLAAANERDLARRARTGDVAARDALITAGMRAVAMRALLHGFRGDEMRDAVQSGAIGLIRAVDRFDPECGTRLATYAWHWIGAAMKHSRRHAELPLDVEPIAHETAHADLDLLGGLPDDLAEVVRCRYGLGAADASPMTIAEVAQHCGLTVAQVRLREAKAMRHLRVGLAKVVHRAPHRGADPL